VALPTEHAVRFYGSPDLKNWNLLSEFGNQGFTGASWECPFLIQLKVNGSPGLKKWVLVNSAAGSGRGVYMQYFVGDFDGKTFKNDNPPDKELTMDYGDCFYAAIPWNNMPDNEKLFIGWLVPGPQETYPWRGQMSIPRDLSLEKTDQGIRLLQQPASIIKDGLKKLPGDHIVNRKDLTINGQKALMGKTVTGGNAYWLDAEWNIKPGTKAGFIIGQQKDNDSPAAAAAIIGYDAATHEVFVARSGTGSGKINKGKLRQTISVPNKTGTIRLQVLVDKSSLEVFVNNGEEVLSTYIFPGKDANGLSAFADGGEAVLRTLKIWNLSK
jgi:levanase/fructan beta-fructosidase